MGAIKMRFKPQFYFLFFFLMRGFVPLSLPYLETCIKVAQFFICTLTFGVCTWLTSSFLARQVPRQSRTARAASGRTRKLNKHTRLRKGPNHSVVNEHTHTHTHKLSCSHTSSLFSQLNELILERSVDRLYSHFSTSGPEPQPPSDENTPCKRQRVTGETS